MTKILHLWEMVRRQKGTLQRRAIHALIAVALRLFFRRIETSGVERVPPDEPLIFVLNHPNGLIDAALVFVALPRRVSFLAKSTLFKMPFVSFWLRTVEALPLYRRVDAAETEVKPSDSVAQNQQTFAACFALLQQNRCIALFPEGVSHNSTQLLPLKTGAARIALGAVSIGGGNLQSLKICAVGLYYSSKTSFRSEALLRFGEPFEIAPVEMDADGQPPRPAVRALSERIADELRAVTLNVEDADALEAVKRTEQIFSSVYEAINLRVSLADELEARRRFAAEMEKNAATNPVRTTALAARLDDYERRLRDVRLSPEHLSVAGHSTWFVFRHFLLRVLLILALSPLVVVGAIIHFPAYLLCLLLGRMFRRNGVDESGGTPKILAAIVLMPLTWLVTAGAVFYFTDWRFALAAIPAVIICGYAALRCLEEAVDLRGWFAAVWFLIRRRREFLDLLLTRRALRREMLDFFAQTGQKRV